MNTSLVDGHAPVYDWLISNVRPHLSRHWLIESTCALLPCVLLYESTEIIQLTTLSRTLWNKRESEARQTIRPSYSPGQPMLEGVELAIIKASS